VIESPDFSLYWGIGTDYVPLPPDLRPGDVVTATTMGRIVSGRAVKHLTAIDWVDSAGNRIGQWRMGEATQVVPIGEWVEPPQMVDVVPQGAAAVGVVHVFTLLGNVPVGTTGQVDRFGIWPGLGGDWTEPPLVTGWDEPQVFCEPNYEYDSGVMWIRGRNLIGTGIESITRIAEDGRSTVVSTGGVAVQLSNDRTYKLLETTAPDGTPLVDPTYEDLAAPNYATYLDYMQGSKGVFAAIDTEAPLAGRFHYEVVVRSSDGSLETMRTDWCSYPYREAFGDTDIPCSPVLLSDPLVPMLSAWVGLLSIEPLTYPAREEVVDIIASHYPVALTDLRSAARTSIRVITRTLGQRLDLLRLVASGRTLLLRNPDPSYPETGWHIAVGEITESRILSDHRSPLRAWELPISVVDRPSGNLSMSGGRTYRMLRTYEPDGVVPVSPNTYEGMSEDYPTYVDVLIGSRTSFDQGALEQDPNLVYGKGSMPTRSAAATSWSLAQ
jgi:hypothetical protein